MPAVPDLEDEAFVDRLRRAGARLRHEPEVRVSTCARLQGRTKIGLAGQLRCWNELPDDIAQSVESAYFLRHRFRTLRLLRRTHAGHELGSAWSAVPILWQRRIERALGLGLSEPMFLAKVDCDSLVGATFSGEREQSVQAAIVDLERLIGPYKTRDSLLPC